MPKMKTHSGAKKRFKLTAKGKVKAHHGMTSHILGKKKTHSGAKKRFRKTAKGKLRARHSFTSHNLGPKPRKRKRRLGQETILPGSDAKRAKKLLGASPK